MIKTDFNNLKTLVVMQLKDKTDLSYLKSPRKTLFAVAGKLGQFVLAGAAFFLFLFLASLLKLFSFTGIVPTTVMTAAYTLFFVLSVGMIWDFFLGEAAYGGTESVQTLGFMEVPCQHRRGMAM